MEKKETSKVVANVKVENSTMKEVVIDIEHRADNYDSCNTLVLPAKKKKGKNEKKEKKARIQLLPKKRKQLEKIVEKKKKKEQRATLLEDLAKLQASSDELQQYVSLTSMQNKGLKRHFRELEMPVSKLKKNEAEKSDTSKTTSCTNSIKGSKKRRLTILDHAKQDKTKYDPNIIGFESSDDSDDESDSNNEDENESCVPDNIAVSTINEKSNETLVEEPQKKIVPTKSPVPKKSVEKQTAVSKVSTPTVFVPVSRTPEIQAIRMKLPIVAEEQVIIETINENPIVIITGETGSGKTTQVPQFLYEAGYAQNKLIGITEPRRVAAMSMSKRVAQEMNLTEKQVSYLIRFEGNVTEETKIKYMTDGVLLKEIQSDFLLKKYSVIILDEAHERSAHTDILIGLLSRIVPLRNKRNNPLKLIIMSATLRVEEFVENTKLFKVKPPVITVDARQFPVTMHFNKRTSENYVNEALRKAIKIHTRLPEGGILIFLTGQQEVHTVVYKLRKLFPLKKNKYQVKRVNLEEKETMEATENNDHSNNDEFDDDDDFDAKQALHHYKQRRKKQIILPIINLDDYSTTLTDDTHEELINARNDEDSLDEDEDEDEIVDFKSWSDAQPLWVLPLYSLLPSNQQAKVFEPPPEGYRLCIVATNVAETSLTIPNIRYVIDSGRRKTRLYDKVTGVSTYHICYTSKAAATQRAGRAGRTRPGHCYRLYSSAVYNDQFEEYSLPEIQKRPIDDLLLQMKTMNINKVVNFPFPTPPDVIQLQSAERRLIILGALESLPKTQELFCAKVTPLGRSIAAFPVIPRYGKMLALSHQHNLMKYTICMVAALSIQEVLIEASGTEGSAKHKWLSMRRGWAGNGNSLFLGDPMVLIKAISLAEYEGSQGKLLPFCEETGLRHKAVVEIRKLRQQLTNEINLIIPDLNLIIEPKMSPPTNMEAKLLRQIILSGMADQIAKKVSPDEIIDEDKMKWKHAYRTPEMEEPVFMHSSSVLRKTSPEWVVYQELYETTKVYMRNITAIQPEWLPIFAPTLCNLSEPLKDPPPRYERGTGKIICRVCGTFGRSGLKLPPMDIEHPLTLDGIKWFACFFLQGEICPKLKQFVPSLLSTPESIIKSWAKLIPRTQVVLQALLSHEIMSKDKLLEIWSSDKTFLLSQYQKWLPENRHSEVALLWPPV
ncbi:probable ATP-dependent RNA helicase kurz [Nylanderia fulva]|uniref:probable ATP-dependent RNA helicase kurz n=1 Tax=Nylanderia fulva TaxID=613905 RepID=UPI0010FAEDB4|nr:probable ATP-dependent RNA helicase kurz [Nylanderia fulva]